MFMNLLKSIVPIAAVAVLLVALYLFKHDEGLTDVEASALDDFYFQVEQQEELRQNLEEALDHPKYEAKKEQILTKFANDKTISIAVVGSDAHSQGELFENGKTIPIPSWPELVEGELNKIYGEGAFDVSYLSGYKDLTTSEFYASKALQEIEAMNPDIILFEPFLLNDHSNITLDQTLLNLSSIIRTMDQQIGAYVVVQPPHPLYQPNLYQEQVDGLAAFMAEEDQPYLDHWSAWPDTEDEQLKKYLLEVPDGKYRPNKKGHTVWSEYIVDYFAGNN